MNQSQPPYEPPDDDDLSDSSPPAEPAVVVDGERPPIRFTNRYFYPYLDAGEVNRLDHETFLIWDRRVKVAQLYFQKKTIREISAELKIRNKTDGIAIGSSYRTIQTDLRVVLGWFYESIGRHLDEHRAQELMQLAQREADIEAEWEKSKKSDAGYGDARLAAILLKLTEMRWQLLGLLDNRKGKEGRDGKTAIGEVKYVAGVNPVEMV